MTTTALLDFVKSLSPRQTFIGVSAAVAVLLVSELSHAHDDWQARYDDARSALIEGHDAQAAAQFDKLARTAPTEEQRKLAQEFSQVARARAAKQAKGDPTIRTSDEISLLYTTAFIYGFETSGWLALQLKPSNFAAAVIPFIGITSATVAGVAWADHYRPLALGTPQVISAGMYLGLMEGIWLVGHQHAVATRTDSSHWKSATVSTVLWSGATLGAIAGTTVARFAKPTPGQTSFVSSAAFWGGLVSAFVGPALQPDPERASETAFVTGGVGYNLGLLGGVLLLPDTKISVARVRFVDLGGLAGGLLGTGIYLLAAGEQSEPRSGLAAAALGIGAGVGFGWWATSSIDAVAGTPASATLNLKPTLLPAENGGWVLGVSGAL